MEIYCSHRTKIVHKDYYNRCPTCGSEWYTIDPIPLVVIGHTNPDDVIVNNVHHTEIEKTQKKQKTLRQEKKVGEMWYKRLWNRIVWATQGNQVNYAEAQVYHCQFCSRKFSKSFFKDICSQCVRNAIVKVLSDEKGK